MQNKTTYNPWFRLYSLLLLLGCTLGMSAQESLDTMAFERDHHYGIGYNFVVKGDSLRLTSQQPEEFLADLATDSFSVAGQTRLVVADVRMMPGDPIDSVWLKIGTEDLRFGWTRESALLSETVPDDPISQCIAFFSDVHVMAACILLFASAVALLVYYLLKRKAYIVHFNDIHSFYPTLLCIVVSVGASLYASIQLFAVDQWQHFYFHPTLNPLAVQPLLALFLVNFWAIILIALATIDDVLHQLDFGDAVLYLLGLMAVCGVDYIVFSLSTLYYVGYLLLVFYICFALWVYFRKGRATCLCGNCGAKMAGKGRCPRCGTVNE